MTDHEKADIYLERAGVRKEMRPWILDNLDGHALRELAEDFDREERQEP